MDETLFYVFVFHHGANMNKISEPLFSGWSIALALANCKIPYVCSKHGFPLT